MDSDRNDVIRSSINTIGHDSFPDNADVTWQVLDIVHKGNYSFVEAEPSPSTVGYPKFKFVLLFRSDAPTLAGCYCYDKGAWSLLFTSRGTPSDWKTL